MFVVTGLTHFNKTRHELVRMMPRAVPAPMWMIYFTGVCEFAGAAGIRAVRGFRGLAGLCLIALLVAMFPANVKSAREKLTLRGKAVTPLWLRLPMQILFIGLLWWSTRW